MTSVTTNLNEGYDNGFHGTEPKHPGNDDYMFGYRIGQTDGRTRQHHLKGKKGHRLDMRDWLNDKADYRNEHRDY